MKGLQKILTRYQNGTATQEEIAFVEKYYQYFETQADPSASLSEPERAAIENKNWRQLVARINHPLRVVHLHQGHFLRPNRWWAAASVILILGACSYFLFFKKTHKSQELVHQFLPADIPAPASNRATITLSNGQIIYLDSAANGTLASIGNVQLAKLTDGKIAYSGKAGKILYNTLSNPRGSRPIDVTLSDGSRVWLNASSSLTYPIAFTGAERNVSITGEAYFEIMKDRSRPFFVTCPLLRLPEQTAVGRLWPLKSEGRAEEGRREGGGQVIEVLGTHFNVNAYADEPTIKTTLLQGAVKVSPAGLPAEAKQRRGVILKPGQQSSVSQKSQQSTTIPVQTVDLEAVMAWKNGYFSFDNTDLQTVMRQIARWYDVSVAYEGKVPDMRFGGEISRNSTVSQVLKILEKSKVHFRIEEKKIFVLP